MRPNNNGNLKIQGQSHVSWSPEAAIFMATPGGERGCCAWGWDGVRCSPMLQDKGALPQALQWTFRRDRAPEAGGSLEDGTS